MITAYKQKRTYPKGDQLWRNPTDRTLRLRIYEVEKRPPTVVVLKPGDTIKFPVWWTAEYIGKICSVLVPASGIAEPAPPPPPSAPPPEAEAPLGDPSAVQSAEDRAEGKEATHTAGDALEAYAQTLMKKDRDQLKDIAKSMGIDARSSKETLARAIALKSVQDPED